MGRLGKPINDHIELHLFRKVKFNPFIVAPSLREGRLFAGASFGGDSVSQRLPSAKPAARLRITSFSVRQCSRAVCVAVSGIIRRFADFDDVIDMWRPCF